jgi:bifunctional UDP-N-acetylglucosamine pyrophosphorylase/glucosamine-1-phosphate N-acetyltransferase
MTTDVEDPAGYGRVISKGELIIEIKEHVDASDEERLIKEINTGICIIPHECWSFLGEIGNNNRKAEYYLTDICTIAKSKGAAVRKYKHNDAAEVLGVNSRTELLDANISMRNRIISKHLKNGVSFIDCNVYIDSDVQIGRDSTVYPNCHISGKTVIGTGVTIGPNNLIRNSRVGNRVSIKGFCVLEETEVNEDIEIGPFSHLKPGTVVGRNTDGNNC